ncbi:uncharacterized protein LOC100901437 [Galendromus occidentalis]|uniref:Uncharacterized protein LOC100901437 n=1 Tax=Galendromus occidentalis TaxID=34638 RepID=A0AAJ6QQU2_9ACAR|nr:uncharacterized protein LOC100901437 [Galendromus occidentalis]
MCLFFYFALNGPLIAFVAMCIFTPSLSSVFVAATDIVGRIELRFESSIYPPALGKFWRTFSGSFLYLLGRALHGIEFHGEENLPKSSGALIVYYHSLMPQGMFYIIAKRYLESGETIGGIVHRDLMTVMSGVCKAPLARSNRIR